MRHFPFPINKMLLFLLSFALSNPTGSPICSIQESKIHVGMSSGSDKSLGYSMTSTLTTNDSYIISFHGPKKTLEGILVYVSGVNSSKHYGGFTFTDKKKFKYLSKEACERQGVVQNDAATVTHQNSNSVNTADVLFTWSPNDKYDSNATNLVVNAVIVSQDHTTPGVIPWQRLDSIPLKVNGTTVKPPVENPSPRVNASTATGNDTTPTPSDDNSQGISASNNLFLLAILAAI